MTYATTNEDFLSDFEIISRRTLSESEHRLFRYRYLLGADWKLCCARLGMNRGEFFHRVYEIQEKLGRAFRETRPYPLYPVYEYYEETHQPAVSCLATEEGKKEAKQRGAERIPRIAPRRASEPYPGEQLPGRRRKIA